MIYALNKSNRWRCTSFGRNTPHKGDLKARKIYHGAQRLTAGFEMKNKVGNLGSGSRLTAGFEMKRYGK